MLEEMTRINRQTVHKILVEDFHLLMPDQKHQHAASSVEFIEMTDDDRNVLKRIVTGDESWCFMYEPETKRQGVTWLSPKKPKAQKVRTQISWVKKMLTEFFYTKGIIQGHTVA
jgi:hypothetical protein